MTRVPAVLWVALTALACGGETPSDPADEVPVITITGIQDGERRMGPVTIDIDVSVGTFQARLNDEPFTPGRTVSTPGAYALVVTARNGGATAMLSLAFGIELAGATRLIIRLFDLGDNESGGGGDAILITDSSSAGLRHILIDAGPSGQGGADQDFVRRRLDALDVDTLHALILSHAHTDHFRGMEPVLQAVVAHRFVHNGQQRTLSSYNALIAQAGQAAGEVMTPDTVVELALGLGAVPTRLNVIPPLPTFLGNAAATGSEINEGSLGAEVRKGPFRMFFTGDGEVRANDRWRTQYPLLTGAVDVLKVGHHGANDAVFDDGFNGPSAWLEHSAPTVAVLSANGRSHPRINATTRLLSLTGTATYCTSVHGEIVIRVGEDGSFAVTVEQNAGADCVPGSEASS